MIEIHKDFIILDSISKDCYIKAFKENRFNMFRYSLNLNHFKINDCNVAISYFIPYVYLLDSSKSGRKRVDSVKKEFNLFNMISLSSRVASDNDLAFLESRFKRLQCKGIKIVAYINIKDCYYKVLLKPTLSNELIFFYTYSYYKSQSDKIS